MDASAWQRYKQAAVVLNKACDVVSGSEELKSHLKQTKYDVFIFSSFFQTCLQSTVLSYQNEDIPLIMYHPGIPIPSMVAAVMGFDTFYAAVTPSVSHALTDEMSFTERATSLLNKYAFNVFMTMANSNYGPILKKNLGAGYPDDIENRVSLMFVTTNFEYDYPFAKTPDIIMTGCLQCRDGKPLPPDLKSFVDDSGEFGAIVFSLGSALRADVMTKEMVNHFKEAFGSVPQRVIWHTDSTTIGKLPENVKIMKWLPIQDLLAHEKTKLFISHGGLLSLQEVVYHGVPYLGFDIKGDKADRRRNVQLAVHRGFGLRLDEHNLTKEVIVAKINELIHDPRYKKNAERIKGYLRDQLVSPKDKAVHMTEYVVRHDGAKHLKSSARNLTTIQLYMLDVLFVATVAFVAVMWILIRVVKFIVNLCKRENKIKTR
ncbi:Ugt37b1 (predicted) [Pycnogonum litorale]